MTMSLVAPVAVALMDPVVPLVSTLGAPMVLVTSMPHMAPIVPVVLGLMALWFLWLLYLPWLLWFLSAWLLWLLWWWLHHLVHGS